MFFINKVDRELILKKMVQEEIDLDSVKRMWRECKAKGRRVYGSMRDAMPEKTPDMRAIEVVAFIQNLVSTKKIKRKRRSKSVA